MPKIITISGKAQHGKDTTANLLFGELTTRKKKVVILHYADYVKYIAKQYFGWDGQKDEKGRTLLQQLGTEKVRSKNPNFWVDTLKNLIDAVFADYDFILIPDARFPNEIGWWDKGYSIFVVRPDFDNGLTEEQKNHRSETALDGFTFDHTFYNTDTGWQNLSNAIDKFLNSIGV